MAITRKISTSKAVNSPLLELFKRDVRRGCIGVEIETMGILGILVLRRRELPLAMVEDVPPLRVDAIVTLAQHCDGWCALEFGSVEVECWT